MPEFYPSAPGAARRGGLASRRRARAKLITPCMEANFPGSEISGETLDFLRAIDRVQQRLGRRLQNAAEVLAVAKSLGYRRTPDVA